MYKDLITSDLHLTVRPLDEYRWPIFPWLMMTGGRKQANRIIIAGDLTDLKDEHSAELVNRIVSQVTKLAATFEVIILKGNHDYVDPHWPYFKFLSKIPNIRFITQPAMVDDVLFLPHTHRWQGDWKDIDFSVPKRIYIHQTVEGAVGEQGRELKGIPHAAFKDTALDCVIIAGDVHVPQTVGGVTYCGCPYPKNFGDAYAPRALFDDGERVVSIDRPTLQKLMVKISHPDELEEVVAGPGDMVKIVYTLAKQDYPLYAEFREVTKRWSKLKDLVLCGVELRAQAIAPRDSTIAPQARVETKPEDILAAYSDLKGIDGRMLAVGQGLVRG